jgi:hypothetical protein
MILYHRIADFKQLLGAILIGLAMFMSAAAQPKIDSVDLIYGAATANNPASKQWHVLVTFNTEVKPGDITKVSLTNFTQDKTIRVKMPPTAPRQGIIRFDICDDNVTPSCQPERNQQALNPAEIFTIAFQIRGETDQENFFLQQRVGAIKKGPALVPRIVESDGKEDADVFISGELAGTRKNRAQFSTEIKAERPFRIKTTEWTPFFNLNASTDSEADPDSMNFGLRYKKNFIRDISLVNGRPSSRRGISSYVSLEGKLESERDFENTNAIAAVRYTLLPSVFPTGRKKRFRVWFEPFAGGEFGKNLRSPLKSIQGNGVSRLLIGSTATLKIFVNKPGLKNIVWQNSYIRRWLLKEELSFKTDDDGDLVLQSLGRGPREYFDSKLMFKFNDYFNPYLAYDWGMVPPSYKKVDHRYRLGFIYQFKIAPTEP